MSDFWVCSDDIDGKENTRINALCDALKNAGHTASNGGVGPNTVQSHGQGGSAKGQIGVFIVGGSDAGMYVDFRDGLKRGYYNYKYMYVVFASDTATTDKWITCNGLSKTPLVRAHDDNYSGANIESTGKSAQSYFNANKQYINYACGPLGCTFNDVIKNFLALIGSGNSSDNQNTATNSGNVKECIQKLLTHWDGDVECVIRGKNMYINHVRDPETTYTCSLLEGVNVFSDDISVTDLNPNTPNHLVVNWTGGSIEFKDELMIARFGEHLKTMEAVKKVVQKVKKKSSDSSSGSGSESSSSSSSGSESSSDGEDTGSDTTTGNTEDSNIYTSSTGYKYNL